MLDLTVTLTSKHKKVLRKTVITNDEPGLILHDFQVLLDFVAEEAPSLTKTHLFPSKVLEALNERLSRSITHGLSRPRQKSFPHINGLFLLLRASGLTQVGVSGRTPILVIDPVVGDSWRELNPTECYFTLLESWLLRGNPEILGERSGYFLPGQPLLLWSELFQQFESRNWGTDDWAERVRYRPGLYNLALMELFGLVVVDDAPAEPKKGWRIDDVRPTEWGEALRTVLFAYMMDNWGDFWAQTSQPQDTPPGDLQPVIQPYRPDWQRTLQLPGGGEDFQEGIFVFKVSLGAKLWRRIVIPAENTLDNLSNAILAAYEFDHDHLYLFNYKTRFGLTEQVVHPYMDERPSTDDVCIGDLPLQPGSQMVYHYDFGDDWKFGVMLERIDPPDPTVQGYRIDERQGKAPEQYSGW